MKRAYFILGMHRSGTSALGGVLELMGLEFGTDLMKATKGNPKGHFENMFVYKLNEKILKENSFAWDSYHFDFNKIAVDKQKEYIKEAKKIIEKEFKDTENFVIKDPRICLLFPIWEKACSELGIDIKIILPYRNPLEVAESLKVRNGFSLQKGYLLWLEHFLLAENYAKTYERMFISFDELINEPKATFEKLKEFIGLELTEDRLEKINEFLDVDIKHNNSSLEDFPKDTPSILQEMIELLKTKDFDNNVKFDSIRNEFEHLVNMFVDNKMSNMINLYPKLEKEYKKLSEKSLNFKIAQDEKKRLEERLKEREESIDKQLREKDKLLAKKEEEIEALNSKIDELIEDNIAFKEKKKSLFDNILKRS
ncbi:hypothetical protein MNB_SV-13-1254 [hydrothermal vent metagenome]|uniref:Sulfotransferase domain-containing protein n=1 Tax=hydrothermal vent metagenome TaxID=652676 RepID=A0A1W1CRR6_9ZZZZ